VRHLFAVCCLLLAACAGGTPTGELQGVVIENPEPKPSFTLTDTEGHPYDFAAQTEGMLTLLYFGYTNCPDICPVHLAQIAETLEQDPKLERETQVVFVTVDPARDTPEVIRAFLDTFSTRFVGLTGSPEEVREAQVAAGVPPATITGDGEDYRVDHAGWVIAYGPDGLAHAQYPFGTRQSVWANDLPALAEMSEAPGPVVTDARIGEPAGAQGALYFTATGYGSDDRLVAVETSVATNTELHETEIRDDGTATMRPLQAFDLPAGGRLVLEPGGYHVMLIDVDRLDVGSAVEVTLVWKNAGEMTIEATVVEAGDTMVEHHG
jgi:protein SCO1/2